jgi:hypothetical protein
MAAIEPGRPSQHVIAILDTIQKIGGLLVFGERSDLESLRQHSDPDVRRKVAQVIAAMGPNGVPASPEGLEPMRAAQPPYCPSGRTRSSDIAVAPRGDRALACLAKSETPPAPRPNSGLADQQKVVLACVQRKAGILRDCAFATAMAISIPIGKDAGAAGFKLYLDRLLKDSGDPTDPIERMIIEQIALAHHRICQLHIQVELAKTAEAAKVYSTAAVRLTGEFRRLALALRNYRQPMPKRMVQFVKQQNLSSGGQQVAYLDQTDSQDQISFCPNETQKGNNRLAYAPQTTFVPKPQTAGSRAAEPALARPADACGARTVAAGRDSE